MMTPFFKYLYCEPHCKRENTELRLSLLQVVLQSQDGGEKDEPSLFAQHLLRLFFDIIPHLQVTSQNNFAEFAPVQQGVTL